MNQDKRLKIENLIKRLKSLEQDANQSNRTHVAYGEDLANRRIALEKQLLDADIEQFYQEEK